MPPPIEFAPHSAVILLSGGLDSATCLALALARGRDCRTISFDYGQRHRHELAAAAALSPGLGAAHHLVVPVGLGAIGGSALTDPGIAVPTAAARVGASPIPTTYVPARNLIFLALATAYAETAGASEIWIGANAVDYSGYPDCREPFLRAFERTAAIGTRAGIRPDGTAAIRVVAPLVHLSKAEIIRVGASLGVDFGLTRSCYDPQITADGKFFACGRCESCAIRRAGFLAAGIEDTTVYAPDLAHPQGAAHG
ncbi:MAG: 7-cyano-7-deazaguanine synthase QueC [Phycisphaerales bacterium]|nr:7-cyano-7-deazaguanine synthase QueC [Phycisphaerales bacterium]